MKPSVSGTRGEPSTAVTRPSSTVTARLHASGQSRGQTESNTGMSPRRSASGCRQAARAPDGGVPGNLYFHPPPPGGDGAPPSNSEPISDNEKLWLFDSTTGGLASTFDCPTILRCRWSG